jgi:ABC-type sugar transport system ATPase subunit
MDVEFRDVVVERDGRTVLELPALRLASGRTTAILGPNGAGKTTLLRVLAGLERPRRGHVRAGAPASRPSQQMAYVFQEDVFLRRSVRANLEFGLRLRGLNRQQTETRIREAAELLGIGNLLDRRADHLSGGEGRRVSLARALSLRAPLLLLDEPLAGLDAHTYSHLLDELPQLLATAEATAVLVTHDRHEALRLAQDLVVLVGGRVLASGDKRDIISRPRVAAVAEVLGYSVLPVGDGLVAVPPGGLRVGNGAPEWTLEVEDVVDLVERRQAVGRIGNRRVHVGLESGAAPPRRGEQVPVHARRVVELEK